MTSQDKIFLREGDNWYLRNAKRLDAASADMKQSVYMRYVHTLPLKGRKALDIGCSNGFRLESLRQKGAEGWGIEPSAKAVKQGRKQYPKLHLVRGLSHDLSRFKDQAFDIVLVSFVLHWVDRSKLMRTVSEIDRILKMGGLVIIQDFYPSSLRKTRYKHVTNKEVFTFKQHYEEMFLTSGLYSLEKRVFFDHRDPNVTLRKSAGDDHASALLVLKKVGDKLYPLKSLK